MAGSRLERFGTVFTRVRDLMHSGIIKSTEKPIWYDVYRAFPPKRDPLYVKPQSRTFTCKKQEAVPEILYGEDKVRAKFYELYGTGARPFDLFRLNHVSTCQRFVDKYLELKSNSELDDSAVFEETTKFLLAEGFVLRRRGAPPVSSQSRDPVLQLKLTDMLADTHTVDLGGSRKA
ncbi:28S ribosomal protein S23 [Nibea albiflora]|uniref:28S ribosomal protein S23 n=1 Tax=Nibea albiflora TaxID=240163 RepID=A0ACB7EN81_NIBAL|nr:28S ribosomal protein S23 [Nibea albiflora]